MRRGLAIAWLLSLTIIAGCSTDGGQPSSVKQAGVGDDPGVLHVHGMGINPKDGALFAATHTGVFRIPESGQAVRMADRWQDTMGFTVVGPDHFLGSGHPDLRDYQAKRLPPLLGLIESTDAGQSWKPLSLLGQSDFHVLRAAHGRIYGFDSTGGAFMVSDDGTSWETRSKLPVIDFAVSPVDPNVIVATTQTGPQHSGDGGRTWVAVVGPSMLFLAWQEPATLWGVAGSGALFTSGDVGASWQPTGTLPGKPDALLASGATLYASVLEGGIYTSTDRGKSWQLRYKNRGQP